MIQDDGTITELMTFEEKFPHHVLFVLWVIQDLDHFSKSTSPGLRAWVGSLNKHYRPPCRATSYKIMFVILSLMKAKMVALFEATRQEIGDPVCGATSDLWSTRNNKVSTCHVGL